MLALRGANAWQWGRGKGSQLEGVSWLDKSSQGEGGTSSFYGNIKVNVDCASFVKMSHLACPGSGSYAQCVRWSTSIMMIDDYTDERSVRMCVCERERETIGMQNKKKGILQMNC